MPRPLIAAAALLAGNFAGNFASAGEPWARLPATADLMAVVDRPHDLVAAFLNHPAAKSAQKLSAVRAALDAPNARRVEQLAAYYEREMGDDWPTILEQVAGRGVAFATLTTQVPAPVVAVAEGTDAAASKAFFELAIRAFEDEVTRQNPDAKLRRGRHAGVATVHFGDDFHAAQTGTSIVFSNRESELHAALTRQTKSMPRALWRARALLPAKPQAVVAFDLVFRKATQASRDYFENTRREIIPTVILGGTIDAVRRADLVAAGFFVSGDRVEGIVRLNARRADLPAELALHVPAAGRPGSLPLLEPPGVAYSQSLTLDVATYWKERATFVSAAQLLEFEKAERDVSKLFAGPSIGQVLEMSGPYHRVVVMAKRDLPYHAKPGEAYPPTALVSSMRDPRFGKSASSILRGAGLVGALAAGLTMADETFDGVKIVTYRFPDGKPLPADPEDLRYNATPCFAVVNDSLVVASEPSVIRALIPELTRPKTPDPAAPAWRAKAYGRGLAAATVASPEAMISGLIQSRNLGLAAAKLEAKQLTDWLATLGDAAVTIDHAADFFEAKFAWTYPIPNAGK